MCCPRKTPSHVNPAVHVLLLRVAFSTALTSPSTTFAMVLPELLGVSRPGRGTVSAADFLYAIAGSPFA